MKELDHALQFGWSTDLWENLKPADQMKRLSGFNESNVEGHLLFSAFLLELTKAEDLSARKRHCGLTRSASV